METTFARWLDEKGESAHAFAVRHGWLGRKIAHLKMYAGIKTAQAHPDHVNPDIVLAIAAETGISCDVLISEMREAMNGGE